MQHLRQGNTAQMRTRWESSIETPGIQLHSSDELKFPGDAVHAVLRADQVCNGAVGCAFVNQIFLSPKLAVKGGSYLLLIIPGKLGDDLRRQLNNASVSLIGNTFSTVLTCSDPRTGNIFPRSVVCVNLGLQNVAAADLNPQVDIKEEKSKVICVSCYAKYNQEGWDLLCGSSFKQTRSAVVDKIRSLTMLPSFDLWGLKIDSNKTTLTCFVRVPEDKAMQLFKGCSDVFPAFRIIGSTTDTRDWCSHCVGQQDSFHSGVAYGDQHFGWGPWTRGKCAKLRCACGNSRDCFRPQSNSASYCAVYFL